MITREELLEIGQFNKVHGVKGEISATIDCEAEDLKRFSCVISQIDGIFVPFFIETLRKKNVNSTLLTIEGFTTDENVKILVNKTIFVLKSEFSKISTDEDCDEMPIDFFIDFSAQTIEGEKLGKIVDVDDSTDNVLFILQDENGKELSVPAVDDFIAEIDEQNKLMVFDLPIGLLDIK